MLAPALEPQTANLLFSFFHFWLEAFDLPDTVLVLEGSCQQGRPSAALMEVTTTQNTQAREKSLRINSGCRRFTPNQTLLKWGLEFMF